MYLFVLISVGNWKLSIKIERECERETERETERYWEIRSCIYSLNAVTVSEMAEEHPGPHSPEPKSSEGEVPVCAP